MGANRQPDQAVIRVAGSEQTITLPAQPRRHSRSLALAAAPPSIPPAAGVHARGGAARRPRRGARMPTLLFWGPDDGRQPERGTVARVLLPAPARRVLARGGLYPIDVCAQAADPLLDAASYKKVSRNRQRVGQQTGLNFLVSSVRLLITVAAMA